MLKLLICSCSLLLFLVISVIVGFFSRKITEPINILTELTKKMKAATDLAEKQNVIKEVKSEPIFKQV
jgi:hypothetical protein